MKKYYLDTNVILRFLLHDNAKLYKEARSYIEKAKNKEIEITIIPEVIFEVDYVLRGVYSQSKSESANIILKLMLTSYLKIIDRSLLIQAAKKYQKLNVDLFDLYLYYKSQENKATVLSFDKDFRKISV